MTDPLEAWRNSGLTPAEARAIQERLAPRVVTDNRLGDVKLVAGADVAFPGRGRTTRAAVCVLQYPSLELVDSATVCVATSFPYVPGLLAFRELPAILAAFERLAIRPDVILCDGHGIAHQRRFGLACYLGLVTGIATIGVAKSRYVGEYEMPATEKGAWTPLWYRDEWLGSVLRTRTRVRPVFVSPGHRVDHAVSREIVLGCAPRYRIPEPTRQADRLAGTG